MFSPGTKRSSAIARRDSGTRNPAAIGSPATAPPENHRGSSDDSSPHRPATGTPAPWARRLSVLARIPAVNKNEKRDKVDPTKPVYVGEFPQVVRDEQTKLLQKRVHGDAIISGGLEKDTCLAWMICGSRVFIWSYLSPASSMKCVVLEIPHNVLARGDIDAKGWMLCSVTWDRTASRTNKAVDHLNRAAIILCNKKLVLLSTGPNYIPKQKQLQSPLLDRTMTRNELHLLTGLLLCIGSKTLDLLAL